jgi:hypothetical protein
MEMGKENRIIREKKTLPTAPQFPGFGLKMSSLPTLAPKSPKKICLWYLGNLWNTCSNFSQKLSFTSSVVSSVGA